MPTAIGVCHLNMTGLAVLCVLLLLSIPNEPKQMLLSFPRKREYTTVREVLCSSVLVV